MNNVLIKKLIDAWNIPGVNPAYHQKCKDRLDVEWGSLYDAIKDIVDHEVDDTYIPQLPVLNMVDDLYWCVVHNSLHTDGRCDYSEVSKDTPCKLHPLIYMDAVIIV